MELGNDKKNLVQLSRKEPHVHWQPSEGASPPMPEPTVNVLMKCTLPGLLWEARGGGRNAWNWHAGAIQEDACVIMRSVFCGLQMYTEARQGLRHSEEEKTPPHSEQMLVRNGFPLCLAGQRFSVLRVLGSGVCLESCLKACGLV